MKLSDLVPSFIKPALRSVHYKLRIMVTRHKNLDELHEYWSKPYDGDNLPWVDYSGKKPDEKLRSLFLVDLVRKYVREDARILEIGCNVGRNLHYLFQSGFKNLEGIEISEQALEIMGDIFPEMKRYSTIYNMPVEKAIKELDNDQYDIILTMAVLEHIHHDSEWIFTEMVRTIKRYLITIEDEKTISWRHFPRQYKKIFESLGLKQIEEIPLLGEKHGLGKNFYARIFAKH